MGFVKNATFRFVDTSGLALAMIDPGNGDSEIIGNFKNKDYKGGGIPESAEEQFRQVEERQRKLWREYRKTVVKDREDGDDDCIIDSTANSKQKANQEMEEAKHTETEDDEEIEDAAGQPETEGDASTPKVPTPPNPQPQPPLPDITPSPPMGRELTFCEAHPNWCMAGKIVGVAAVIVGVIVVPEYTIPALIIAN